jgi:hypothetical protein
MSQNLNFEYYRFVKILASRFTPNQDLIKKNKNLKIPLTYKKIQNSKSKNSQNCFKKLISDKFSI